MIRASAAPRLTASVFVGILRAFFIVPQQMARQASLPLGHSTLSLIGILAQVQSLRVCSQNHNAAHMLGAKINTYRADSTQIADQFFPARIICPRLDMDAVCFLLRAVPHVLYASRSGQRAHFCCYSQNCILTFREMWRDQGTIGRALLSKAFC